MRIVATLVTTLAAAASLLMSASAPMPADGASAAPPPASSAVQPFDRPTSNTPYDGRFAFARIRFTPPGGASGWQDGRPDMKWDHDFPRAERNFMKLLAEVSSFDPVQGGGNVFALDDPELMKYPVAYLCEPGYWVPNDSEVAALRAFLTKGGYLLFDDFFGQRTFENLSLQLRRVLPEARLVRLDGSEQLFDTFFHIDNINANSVGSGFGRRGPPEFWGVYEDNDPTKRLMIVANYNNDIGESWEFSDTGIFPVEVTSESYKLGVNYLMYGITH